MSTVLGLLAVVALVAANGLFVAAEFSLTSVDRGQVRRRDSAGDRRAARVQMAVRELSFHLSGAQFGITICSLLLGFVAGPVLADLLVPVFEAAELPEGAVTPVAIGLALLLATLTQMLFGELVPQNLAIARPMRTALWIAPLQRSFSALCRPVIALFNNTANALVRGLGVEPQEELRAARTPTELASLIGTSAEEGTLAREVAALLRRTLDFGGKTAGDVLTPRMRVVALTAEQTAAEVLDLARASGHSRFPVHQGDLDDVAGVVHVKHVFAVPPDRRDRVPVRDLMVEPVAVPESLRCGELLSTLRRHSLQLAVVVDEYGGTAGVVTLEDLVEELVGQVRDEHDRPEVPPVLRLSDGSVSASGLLRREEFGERLGLAGSPRGVYDTLAGLVLERLGRVPEVGEEVVIGGWHFTVTSMDSHRIDRVRVRPPDGSG